jgi:hypothetical protein
MLYRTAWTPNIDNVLFDIQLAPRPNKMILQRAEMASIAVNVLGAVGFSKALKPT